MKAWLFRLGDAVSQFFNVIAYWQRGSANNSISGDAYRFDRKRTQQFIDWLFSWYETEHCRKSYEKEVQRAKDLVDEASLTRFVADDAY